MREFKFRAWDTKNKLMLMAPCLDFGYETIYHLYKLVGDRYEPDLDNGTPFGTRFELMQFTGLHDRNGKEIYEGDILVSTTYSWNKETGQHDIPADEIYEGPVEYGQITLSTGITGFGEGQGSFSTMGFFIKGYMQGGIYKGMKIIGNIYENPNLIKV